MLGVRLRRQAYIASIEFCLLLLFFFCRAALYGELRKVEKIVKETYEKRVKNGETNAKKPFKLVPMRYYPCLSDDQLYSNLSKPKYPRVYKIGKKNKK